MTADQKDDVEEVVQAFLATSSQNRHVDYLKRGRIHASKNDPELVEAWAASFIALFLP